MPQITVTAGKPGERVLLSEWVNVEDFESGHFRAQLGERLAWAVGDADQAEQAERPGQGRRHRPGMASATSLNARRLAAVSARSDR